MVGIQTLMIDCTVNEHVLYIRLKVSYSEHESKTSKHAKVL